MGFGKDISETWEMFGRAGPMKWVLGPVVVLLSIALALIHEQKNIREVSHWFDIGAAPEPSSNSQTAAPSELRSTHKDELPGPTPTIPSADSPSLASLTNIWAIAPDGGPMTLGNVDAINSRLSGGSLGVIQNGRVRNYNTYVESTGPVIQNGDVENRGGVVRGGTTSMAVRDGGSK